jgi:hypothetical protein
LLGGCLLYGYLQQPADASPDYARWSPSPAAIRRTIGTAAAPTKGMADKERRQQFCKMFKNRFRKHDPAVAVGLRFLTPTRIKLMCPARMEPCFIDQIALSAWHEAQDCFGAPMDIDINDTFIGTNQIKIGELRVQGDTPPIARIAYDFTALSVYTRPRTVPLMPGGPFRIPVPRADARAPAQPAGRSTL